MNYGISREIGIDMGHRVTHHGSKCKNVHGHRYRIEAHCGAESVPPEAGEQQGMVLDFGFLKDIMMRHIDAPCDHGLVLWIEDPLVARWFGIGSIRTNSGSVALYRDAVVSLLKADTPDLSLQWDGGKLLLVNFVPTAENLARHWFTRMKDDVEEESAGLATLHRVIVHETPNCFATYEP